jgi:uncharacterized surface protein with fasciclin (FAS1) repeats
MKFIALSALFSALYAQSIIETLTANNLTGILAAIQKANLTEALAGLNPVTIFVPTNAALEEFKDLTNDQLKEILMTHVVSGTFKSTDLKNMTIPTFNQKENLTIVVAGDKVTVNGISVVKADIAISQGIAHVIEKVIIPSSLKLPQTTTTTETSPKAEKTAGSGAMVVSLSALSLLGLVLI